MSSTRRNFLVKYEYQVSGKKFTGDRVALYTLIYEDEVDELADKFKEGGEATVFYEPNNPSESVLVTGGRSNKKNGEVIVASAALIFSIVLISFGIIDLSGA